MKVVKAVFRRLNEVTLEEVYGMVGVYILWSGRAISRPTYIGEGVILNRFAKHVEELPWPVKGVLAIIGDNIPKYKTDCEVLEAILLDIAYEVDRFPTQNQAAGKKSRVTKIFRKHGKLRIYIRGYDPLRHPKNPLMRDKKIIELWRNTNNEIDLRYPWHLRLLR